MNTNELMEVAKFGLEFLLVAMVWRLDRRILRLEILLPKRKADVSLSEPPL